MNHQAIDNTKYATWLTGNGPRTEVTASYYDHATHYSYATPFDSLTYKYHEAGGKRLSNRLYHVNDKEDENLMADDIDDQGPFDDNPANINLNNNYSYDETGNLIRDKQEKIEQIEWTVSGKVSKIIREANSTLADLEFRYDALGNRVMKIVKPDGTSAENGGTDDPTEWTVTHYVRDASGNVMAVYDEKYPSQQLELTLKERYLYGSSRLGMNTEQIDMLSTPISDMRSRNLGKKYFELNNHLGNVLAVVTDKKIPIQDGTTGMKSHYVADVVSVTDYYPFGAVMGERTFIANAYRYGFNSFEKDDEVKGVGNHISFGDYGYDTRSGRRFNLDPKTEVVPNESPYSFSGNNPIAFIDPDGKFKLKYTEKSLEENGLTKQDIVRFEAILSNISNLIKDNPHALEAISKTTGFDNNKIFDDFAAGEGPIIELFRMGSTGSKSGIVIDAAMVKALANIDGTNKAELSNQTLGVALTIIHEYGHHGDQVTNNGKNTGQYNLDETTNSSKGKNTKRNYILWGNNNAKEGTQYWRTTLTGHRGTDIEVAGFGVQVTAGTDGRTKISPGTLSPTTASDNITIPSLPSNAIGNNILNTLGVE